ncbi:MAG: TMEM43 family protein [Pseudomonadota bacterium]
MSDDQYREITTTSWVKRIGNSLKGIIIGIILFLLSFPLIWWNEGRSVDRIKTLDEGRGLVVAVSADKVDAANNDALIHISGKAVTDDILKDSFFGVEENALKLKRKVEMYQWKETSETKTKKNLGGSETKETIYKYRKIWSEKVINSSNFKKPEGHQNPSSMPYKTQIFTASNINVGAFNLSKPFIGKINKFSNYPISQQNFNAMDEMLQQSFKLNGNEYFYGNPNNPEIGATRITYNVVKPLDVSVIGKQNKSLIDTYFTNNGNIEILENGRVSAEKMFSSAESENNLATWVMRLIGLVMMWTGLAMVFAPIKVLGDVVPLFGTILGAGIGIVAGVISLVLSFVTIALAWLFYRPIIGSILLLAAGLFLFGGFRVIKEKLKKIGNAAVPGTTTQNSKPASGEMGWNPENHR